eukprot:3420228-Karenia_brevis.AAC.1
MSPMPRHHPVPIMTTAKSARLPKCNYPSSWGNTCDSDMTWGYRHMGREGMSSDQSNKLAE